MEAIKVRLRRRAVADYSWLPELVEVGGFHYEAGQRFFEPWSACLKSLLGDAIQPLLQETWGYIPRAAAEKFAGLVNGVLSERDRLRIEQAYTRLKFPTAPVPPIAPSEAASQFPDEAIHEHVCSQCGAPFQHEAWECVQPYDRLCNLCAEQEMGPMPVFAQRWNRREDIAPEELIARMHAASAGGASATPSSPPAPSRA